MFLSESLSYSHSSWLASRDSSLHNISSTSNSPAASWLVLYSFLRLFLYKHGCTSLSRLKQITNFKGKGNSGKRSSQLKRNTVWDRTLNTKYNRILNLRERWKNNEINLCQNLKRKSYNRFKMILYKIKVYTLFYLKAHH